MFTKISVSGASGTFVVSTAAIGTNIGLINGQRGWLQSSGVNNGTTDRSTNFGAWEINDTTLGGVNFIGYEATGATGPSAMLQGRNHDGGTWPAVVVSGMRYLPATSNGFTGYPGTDQLFGICVDTGGTLCANPLWTMLGSGEVVHNVWDGTVGGGGIRTSSAFGYGLVNPVASSGGNTQQYSPTLYFGGSAWNSSGLASEIDRWRLQNRPTTVAGTTTSTLFFSASINSASSFTDKLSLTSGGVLAVATVNATSAFQANGTPITSGTTLLSAGSGMSVANVGANSCGTTSATIAGNNNLFTVTVGATSGTQCRVAFTVTAATAWGCAANDDTTTTAVRTTPVDTTHLDLIGAFVAGDTVTAICFPR